MNILANIAKLRLRLAQDRVLQSGVVTMDETSVAEFGYSALYQPPDTEKRHLGLGDVQHYLDTSVVRGYLPFRAIIEK